VLDNKFWELHYERFSVTEPSAFAMFCADEWIDDRDTVVEIGCGNGRDGVFLATKCSEYYAVDSSTKAIEQFERRLGPSKSQSNIKLFCGDVKDFDLRKIIPKAGGKIFLYLRFSLHSLDEETEKYILTEFAQLTHPGVLAVEARTIFDPLHGVGIPVGRNAFMTDHYRRFIDPLDFLGFAIGQTALKFFVLSDGFAITETEDPIVLRAILCTRLGINK